MTGAPSGGILTTIMERSEKELSKLKAQVRDLTREVDALRAKLKKVQEEKEELERKLKQEEWEKNQYKWQAERLTRRLFGRKSERVTDNIHPLPGFEEPGTLEPVSEVAVEEAEHPQKAQRPRSRPVRRRIPPELPRVEKILPVPEEQKICGTCRSKMKFVGHEKTEYLRYIPARVYAERLLREKYICPECKKTAIAPMPPRPIDKSKAGPELLAGIATAKYADHLPLYRQEKIFKRAGLDISRSTMCDWIGQVAGLLEPVYDCMSEFVLSQDFIQADDTSLAIKAGPKEKVSKGYLLAYGIPYGEVIFKVINSKSQEECCRPLAGFTGVLQADATAGFKPLYESGLVRHAGCMAHARRRFYDARKQAPEEAKEVLRLIRDLYKIEAEAREKGLDSKGRAELRKEKARPLLSKLKTYVQKLGLIALPKSPLGQAITYMLTEWETLTLYVKNGRVEIDNNCCENALRVPVLGRKNWLMLGTKEDPHRAAILYSLVVSCQRLGIDPYTYLVDAINAVSVIPATQVWEVTPRGYLEAKLGRKLPVGPPYNLPQPP